MWLEGAELVAGESGWHPGHGSDNSANRVKTLQNKADAFAVMIIFIGLCAEIRA